MMPPSITKYGSPVRLDAQIVALRPHCARSARALRLRRPHRFHCTPSPKCSSNYWTRKFAKFQRGFISHSSLKIVWKDLHEIETQNIPR